MPVKMTSWICSSSFSILFYFFSSPFTSSMPSSTFTTSPYPQSPQCYPCPCVFSLVFFFICTIPPPPTPAQSYLPDLYLWVNIPPLSEITWYLLNESFANKVHKISCWLLFSYNSLHLYLILLVDPYTYTPLYMSSYKMPICFINYA